MTAPRESTCSGSRGCSRKHPHSPDVLFSSTSLCPWLSQSQANHLDLRLVYNSAEAGVGGPLAACPVVPALSPCCPVLAATVLAPRCLSPHRAQWLSLLCFIAQWISHRAGLPGNVRKKERERGGGERKRKRKMSRIY